MELNVEGYLNNEPKRLFSSDSRVEPNKEVQRPKLCLASTAVCPQLKFVIVWLILWAPARQVINLTNPVVLLVHLYLHTFSCLNHKQVLGLLKIMLRF